AINARRQLLSFEPRLRSNQISCFGHGFRSPWPYSRRTNRKKHAGNSKPCAVLREITPTSATTSGGSTLTRETTPLPSGTLKGGSEAALSRYLVLPWFCVSQTGRGDACSQVSRTGASEQRGRCQGLVPAGTGLQ